MKVINLLLLIGLLLYGDIITLFKNKEYEKICNYKNIKKFENNINLESLVGLSCVRSDKLMLLPYIIKRLKTTSKARKNAIYFLTIYMQKRLIYSYFFDNISLEGFSFPKTDYFLSYIFDKIKNNNFEKKDNKIVIKNNGIVYILYKDGTKLIVESFKNNKLIKRRWYR